MKFWQHFEIYEVYVCAKFQGIESRDFGFKTQKPLQKFGVEGGHIKKRLKYGKKYFHWLYVVRYPFIPTCTLDFWLSWIFLLFFFFCFVNLVCSSSPKPQNIKI